jgi:ATP-dependent Clp protease adaptor protein ClpS
MDEARYSFVLSGDHSDSSDDGGDSGTAIVSRPRRETKPATKTPPLYRVVILNDDFTPMDFVIHVLQKFFQKEYTEATQIMLQVHSQGAGVCGVFTFEIAETKVYLVNQYSRQNKHPLKCTMERA